MSERSFSTPTIMAVVAGMLFCLLLMALHYIRGISELLYEEAKDNISEIAAQGAGRFTDSILIRLGEAREAAVRLSYAIRDDTLSGAMEDHFLRFVNKKSMDVCLRYSIALPDGNALREDGHRFDVTGELGFQRALRGLANVSEPFYSVYSGLRVLAIYSPVVVKGHVEGVLRVAASVDCFYEAFGASFYRGHGFSYILSTTGRLISGSTDKRNPLIFSNIFDLLEEDPSAEDRVEQLREAMGQGKEGAITLKMGRNGDEYLISYDALPELDWYFVTLVPKDVILENSHEIMLRSSFLCGVIILVIFTGLLLFMRERSRNQAHVMKLAFVDELTGLPNRNRLLEVEKSFPHTPQNETLALVVFDIDNFKLINENFGYKTGDRILQSTAAVITEEIDETFEFGVRTGGDLFALVLCFPDGNRDVLERRMYVFMDKITAMVEQSAAFVGPLKYSCGICEVLPEYVKGSRCYDYADIARKHVKKQNDVSVGFFEESMLTVMRQEKEIESSMEKALADGEFQVYLQPKIDLRSESLKGAEALVRWIRPDKGSVPPNDFIPLFERNGFVVKLDYYVMEEVCKIKSRWCEQGWPDWTISVNMSQYHLVQKDFVSTLETIAHTHDISPETLEIEITESAFYSDSDAYEVMEDIKAAGFKLSMDDFGAGYSTLNMLRRMPVDVLKIDKQFLDESEASERTRAIISSIIHMAYKIGADVICEGVETLRQVEFLKSIGCNLVQGHFYSRPLPINEFEKKYCGTIPEPKTGSV